MCAMPLMLVAARLFLDQPGITGTLRHLFPDEELPQDWYYPRTHIHTLYKLELMPNDGDKGWWY